MVDIHIFHKLEISARLYMEMASWGFSVLVFDSFGEPANCPKETVCGVPCSSGTEFAVGRSTSEEEAVGAATGAPMEIPSSLWHHCTLCWQIRDNSSCFALFQVWLIMFNVSPGLAMCRQKQKCGIREDENTPSSHVVSFLYRVWSQAQLNSEVASGAENCLEQAFEDGIDEIK